MDAVCGQPVIAAQGKLFPVEQGSLVVLDGQMDGSRGRVFIRCAADGKAGHEREPLSQMRFTSRKPCADDGVRGKDDILVEHHALGSQHIFRGVGVERR